MNAFERTNCDYNQPIYQKRGRKYIQVSDPYAYNGLREGWWLVKVAPGCTSIRECVRPAKAELMAAIKDKEEDLAEIIRKCSEARPKEGVPLSEEARKDWEWFVNKHGKEFNVLYYPSIQENAQKIIAEILK